MREVVGGEDNVNKTKFFSEFVKPFVSESGKVADGFSERDFLGSTRSFGGKVGEKSFEKRDLVLVGGDVKWDSHMDIRHGGGHLAYFIENYELFRLLWLGCNEREEAVQGKEA